MEIVVKVAQNWSLECKTMFAGRPKIGARFVDFGARFWLPLGGFLFVKNRRPNGGIQGPILRNSFFFRNMFLGQISYNFMGVTFTINIGFVSV